MKDDSRKGYYLQFATLNDPDEEWEDGCFLEGDVENFVKDCTKQFFEDVPCKEMARKTVDVIEEWKERSFVNAEGKFCISKETDPEKEHLMFIAAALVGMNMMQILLGFDETYKKFIATLKGQLKDVEDSNLPETYPEARDTFQETILPLDRNLN